MYLSSAGLARVSGTVRPLLDPPAASSCSFLVLLTLKMAKSNPPTERDALLPASSRAPLALPLPPPSSPDVVPFHPSAPPYSETSEASGSAPNPNPKSGGSPLSPHAPEFTPLASSSSASSSSAPPPPAVKPHHPQQQQSHNPIYPFPAPSTSAGGPPSHYSSAASHYAPSSAPSSSSPSAPRFPSGPTAFAALPAPVISAAAHHRALRQADRRARRRVVGAVCWGMVIYLAVGALVGGVLGEELVRNGLVGLKVRFFSFFSPFDDFLPAFTVLR